MNSVQMKSSFTLTIALTTLLMLPLMVNAATITGKINGFECAVAGKVCPIDKLDPHITLESDFVLQEPDGTFYLLPNVPRDIKVRYVLEEVQVTGDLNEKYKSIRVEEFRVKRDGAYKTVWSQAMQREQFEELYGPPAH